MDENFIRKRMTELRMKKGVSEYQMSLDMGHSRNYIQNISNGRALPSMPEFLYMCEYLDVTPSAFSMKARKIRLSCKRPSMSCAHYRTEMC